MALRGAVGALNVGAYLRCMNAKRTPTLTGRILRGIARGIVDGLPGVSQVANVIRQHKAEQSAAVPTSTDEPVTRTLTGWLTLGAVAVGFASSLASGSLDCEALRELLQAFRLLP
jgi:hypothetical protein